MSPLETIRRLERLDEGLDGMVTDAIESTADDILQLNQKQLFSGRLSDGTPLTPSYLDDPYFSNREAAQQYSDWKDEITPDPERPPGVPNLFINGRFYESWRVSSTAGKLTITSSDPNAVDIEEKFSDKIYGLDSENMTEYRREAFLPVLKEAITSQTGLTFS